MKNYQRVSGFVTQRGLTLVELMISLALGLMLMIGAITLFQGNKQTYYFQESLARLQENGRFAMDMIGRDIRSSGYRGCATRTWLDTKFVASGVATDSSGDQGFKMNNTLAASTVVDDFDNIIRGDTAGSWTTIDSVVPKAGSDVLVLYTQSGGGMRVKKHVSRTSPLYFNSCGGTKPECFNAGDIVMVANCKAATIFEVSSAAMESGDAKVTPVAADLFDNFQQAEVIRTGSMIYLIDANNVLQRIGNGVADELVRNVSNLQFSYGIDTNGDGLDGSFIQSAAVTNWDQVVAVRIAITLSSDDGGLQKTFTNTVAIRNGAQNDF